MTDNTQENGIVSENTDNSAVNDAVSTETGSSTAENVASESAPTEKMVPQSVVDKIVGSSKKEAYEKAYQKAQQEVMAQYNSQNNQAGQAGQSGSEGQNFDINQITQQIYSKFEQDNRIAQANKIAQEYEHKMQQEFYSDPDFMDRYKESQIESHPQIVLLANELPNTGAVMKDMVDNPLKFANILTLAGSNPSMARRELVRLSKSLQEIETAKSQPKSTQPLGQAKPSVNGIGGAGEGGNLSVSDIRKKYF